MQMDPVDTAPVMQLFEALTNRDFEAARRLWLDDGTWHLGGSHDLAGDYMPDDYIEILRGWVEKYPEYTATDFSMQQFGTDVVAVHLVTTGGRAQGEASGLLIYRVKDGAIAEGWAIPTSWQGSQPF